jgi:hypothetical protein
VIVELDDVMHDQQLDQSDGEHLDVVLRGTPLTKT